MAMIETRVIDGAAVYGVEQCSYIVDGAEDRDYTAALAAAAFKQAAAVEVQLDSMNAVVRTRQTKITELNNGLTTLVRASATIKTDGSSSDKSDKIDELRDVAEIVRKYQIQDFSLTGDDGNQITRGVAQKVCSNFKHAIDLEGNSLQQDTVTLQNLIQKRDSTYQTLVSLVKKSLNAGAATIKSLGK
jgi:hypothetical protein